MYIKTKSFYTNDQNNPSDYTQNDIKNNVSIKKSFWVHIPSF